MCKGRMGIQLICGKERMFLILKTNASFTESLLVPLFCGELRRWGSVNTSYGQHVT